MKKAREKFKKFKGLNVAGLWLTFKQETDELREAPSLENMPILLEEGTSIKAYDSVVMDN